MIAPAQITLLSSTPTYPPYLIHAAFLGAGYRQEVCGVGGIPLLDSAMLDGCPTEAWPPSIACSCVIGGSIIADEVIGGWPEDVFL